MDKYLGLDVHATSCTLAVVSSRGSKLHESVVATDARALGKAIKTVKGSRHLRVEDGMHSTWIHKILEPCVDEIVVTRGLGTVVPRTIAATRRY